MTEQSKFIKRLKQQDRHGAQNVNTILADLYTQLEKVFEVNQKGAKDLIRQNVFTLLADGAQDAYDKVNILEKRNRGLSESLKINTERAAELGYAFDKQATAVKMNADKLKQYAGELNKVFVGQSRFLANADGFGKKVTEQLKKFRAELGMSDESYQQLLKNQALFTKQGQSVQKGMEAFEDLLKDAATEYGQSFEAVEATVAEIVAGMDSETAARFSRQIQDSPKAFIKSALEAKKLGLEMSKILSIGDNFLDVESAIANEIELQALGAKKLNVAEIQRATLAGDTEALQHQISEYVAANGEELKRNPYLLQKSAEAFGLQKSELLDIYAQQQLNNEATASGVEAIQATAAATTDIRSKKEQMQDEANINYADAIVKSFTGGAADMSKHVTEIAKTAMDAQTAALSNAERISKALGDSRFLNTIMASMKTYDSVVKMYNVIKGGNVAGAEDALGAQTPPKAGDLFIPASSGDTVISGPFGAFTMHPGDDILAAPNIREAAGGGTAALVAALSKMSFHVTNVFDGDKINSSLTIRQGQTLNNINNIA